MGAPVEACQAPPHTAYKDMAYGKAGAAVGAVAPAALAGRVRWPEGQSDRTGPWSPSPGGAGARSGEPGAEVPPGDRAPAARMRPSAVAGPGPARRRSAGEEEAPRRADSRWVYF